MNPFRTRAIGMRLSLFAFFLIATVFLLFVLALTHSASNSVEEQAEARISEQDHAMVDMISTYNAGLVAEVGRFMSLLQTSFVGDFSLDPGQMTTVGAFQLPALEIAGSTLNLAFTIPDQFTAKTGAVVTVFERHGDDFVRVTTSLKKQNGERALGTQLDHQHPAYRQLLQGQLFSGLATLFGKQYITQYKPIEDSAGHVIGALFVGVDVSAEIEDIKQKIRRKTIGEHGFFFVLDADPSHQVGQYLVHPTDEGKSALDQLDRAGNAVFKQIIADREGQLVVDFGGEQQTRLLSYTYEPNWHWIIGGNVDPAELTASVRAARIRYAGFGLVLVLLLSLGNFLIVRSVVSKPLQHAVRVAKQLAAGDLTQQSEVARDDEIGQLLAAINGIGTGLAEIVTQVRHAAGVIDESTSSIAADTSDIAQRITSQASSLEQTAASMEEITSTVQQNSANAMSARELALQSSQQAGQGGTAVERVVQTMAALNNSSQKIGDIVAVIESIAFQTNILALNAAVEAARAGPEGRGFAVVAAEVRALAKRSADAAKEIATLLHESIDQINQGYAQADAAGDTMREVVSEVRKMSSVVDEITLASHEQSSGIEQVNLAVSQIGNVMQQNATLINQAEDAAAHLSEKASELTRAVAIFKL